MKRPSIARAGRWVVVGILALAAGLVVGLAVIDVAIPRLERAGVIVGTSTPAPTGAPAATPTARVGIDMGGAIIPDSAQCTGCHATGTGTMTVLDTPVMGHPLEGWSKCTGCHAPARLVATAPGHSGIHASECTICHKPGDLPAPLSRPHRDNQNVACLSCHGSIAPLPSDMTHRTESVCWLCHRLPTIEPPVPAHATAPGEADCLTCHVAGGQAGGLPADHVARPASLCLSCHEVTLGTAPARTPGIMVWPAPSTTPAPLATPPVNPTP